LKFGSFAEIIVKALEVFRSDSTRRFLLVAFFTLTVVLLAARWAAREFPLSNHYAWRTGIWADDRYLLVSQQSKSSQRWGRSTRAKYFLIDCEQESWTDLGRELGIDDFSPEDSFCTPDGCFFLPRYKEYYGSFKQGIKYDPRTKKTIAIPPFDSSHFYIVGNQYLLSTTGRRCLNLKDNIAAETSAFPLFGAIRPVDGEPSFIVEFRYQPTVSQPVGSGMGGMASYGGEDVPSAASLNQLRDESNSPDDNDASPAIGEETQLTAEEAEIQAEAIRLGLQPADLVLSVLYHIVGNQPVEMNRWFTRTSNRTH
jgi:hypothetical protein